MPSIANASDNGERKQRQPEQELVCVTGAGGFIGSWVVKELLLRGYHVRGTARDPADRKNAHLLVLERAEERLTLCRADVRCEDDSKSMAKPYKFSNRRLRELGLEFTPVRESLYETVTCLQKKGHLPRPVVPMAPKRAYL